MPSLTKASFIAQKLGVSVGRLTGENLINLPPRYVELKYQLLHSQTFRDEQRFQEREDYLDEILNKYYDLLPEEEQLVVDCLQALLDTTASREIHFGSEIVQEYFPQVIEKSYYTENDLVLLTLYLNCLVLSGVDSEFYHMETYRKIFQNLVDFEEHVSINNLYLVNKIYPKLFGISQDLGRFDDLESLLSAGNRIMKATNDFQQLPILNLMAWKHQLYHINDLQAATSNYDDSLRFAEMIGDSYLIDNIKKEWLKDLATQAL